MYDSITIKCKQQNRKKSPGSIDFLTLPGLTIFTGCQRPDFITKDKHWKLIDHDYIHPDKKLYSVLMEASRQYDVNDPNFDDFIANGGKMILFAGWNDMSISPWQTVEQYKRYIKKYGRIKTESFIKFYCMPGVVHCYGIKMDYLEWLDRWCTTGSYPEETLYGKMLSTGGNMPMAEYPGWIRYTGGDPMDGKSYVVVQAE